MFAALDSASKPPKLYQGAGLATATLMSNDHDHKARKVQPAGPPLCARGPAVRAGQCLVIPAPAAVAVVVPVVVFVVLVAFLATVFLVVVVFVFATSASWERCEHFCNSHAGSFPFGGDGCSPTRPQLAHRAP